MSYMWTEFNIKTFPAETVVFRDGVFCPELSTLKSTNIDRNYDLPVHIIYIGDLAGKNELNINISAAGQKVFLSAKIKNKKPAFLNIFIKNTGKNSEFRGHVMMQNDGDLTYECVAQHGARDTVILLKNKLIAGEKTKSKIGGVAIIEKGCDNCTSDVGFSAMADKGARIEFTPAQRICAIPHAADHSASIFKGTDFQIQYLRESGLSGAEADDALREAFMNDFPLF